MLMLVEILVICFVDQGVWWNAKVWLRPSHPPAASLVSGLLDSVLTPGPGGGGGESVGLGGEEEEKKKKKKKKKRVCFPTPFSFPSLTLCLAVPHTSSPYMPTASNYNPILLHRNLCISFTAVGHHHLHHLCHNLRGGGGDATTTAPTLTTGQNSLDDPPTTTLIIPTPISSDVDSVPIYPYQSRKLTSRIGLIGHLRAKRTGTGTSVPGSPL
nr:unnamed protein product [Spirometra erinaceieuropaei]